MNLTSHLSHSLAGALLGDDHPLTCVLERLVVVVQQSGGLITPFIGINLVDLLVHNILGA